MKDYQYFEITNENNGYSVKTAGEVFRFVSKAQLMKWLEENLK